MTARCPRRFTRTIPGGFSLAPRRWETLAFWTLTAIASLEVARAGLGAWRAGLAPVGSWSPGVLVHQFAPHLAGILLGLTALRFLGWRQAVALDDVVPPPAPRAAAWRSACGRATSDLTIVLVLAGYRDLMRGELFATRYGQAQFVGSLAISDLLGPATFAALVAVMWTSVERWASEQGVPEPRTPEHSQTAEAVETWVGHVFLLACILSIRRYFQATQGSIGATHTVLVEAWQCWLVADLVRGSGLPIHASGGWSGWLRREHRPLVLLATLEIVRVVSLGDRTRTAVWLAATDAPVSDTVLSLSGRIHDWVGISVAGAALALALVVYLSGFNRRPARSAS